MGQQLFGVDVAVDEPSGAKDTETPVSAIGGFRCDDVRDMQPGQRRPRRDVIERLMDGVVGADQKIGSDSSKFSR